MERTYDDWTTRRLRAVVAGTVLLGAMPAPLTARDPAEDVVLELASSRAGEAPAHRLRFDVAAGDPEITRAELTYPAGFLIRGFTAPGTVVGAFEVDVDGDGTPERRAPVQATGPLTAFVDAVEDGRLDPVLEPRITIAGNTIAIHLPFGGDGDPSTTAAPFATSASVVLSPGVIASPALGGRYVVAGRLAGTAGSREVELPVEIHGPRLTRFAALVIDDVDVDLKSKHADRMRVRGRFVLSKASDGIDLRHEHVAVTAGPFRQTVPGHAFRRAGPNFHYKGPAPGIRSFTLHRDGRFEIEASGLTWPPDLPKRLPLTFALRIGNDLGETTLVDRPRPRF